MRKAPRAWCHRPDPGGLQPFLGSLPTLPLQACACCSAPGNHSMQDKQSTQIQCMLPEFIVLLGTMASLRKKIATASQRSRVAASDSYWVSWLL